MAHTDHSDAPAPNVDHGDLIAVLARPVLSREEISDLLRRSVEHLIGHADRPHGDLHQDATHLDIAHDDGRASPATHRFQRSTALSSSRPFLADAGLDPGNCAGMEETAGAPSSFAALSPRRLRASSRDRGGVVNRPPSPLTMLLSRHTRRLKARSSRSSKVLLAVRLPLPLKR